MLACSLLLFLVLPSCSAGIQRPGSPLTADQAAVVAQATALMRTKGLTAQADLSQKLLDEGVWRSANPDDQYIAQAEKDGDTPYAYTLSPGRKPLGIVLAARFFQATPTGQAALMIHEMGHYTAYVNTGKSDEYDGYKAEYDTHTKLGLSVADGLVYFAMLDGVVENVVPRAPSYKHNTDIQQYINGNP